MGYKCNLIACLYVKASGRISHKELEFSKHKSIIKWKSKVDLALEKYMYIIQEFNKLTHKILAKQ